MDLKGIMSISGYGGLFRMVKPSKNGFVVESLDDGKRMQTFATSKISSLEEIAIYTETAEVHLKDVLKSIFRMEEGKPLNLHAKSLGDDLKAYFLKVLPDYDQERVYVSDIKKVVTWYNQLVGHNLIDLEEDVAEEPKDMDTAEKELEEQVEKNDSTKEKSKSGKTKK
jgi:hypothetical protein